ncbi:TPA: putative holin-like toxin [Streptococcus suis]|nr:putative holin-like toxin [Streptococcus suis]HEM3181865.1 putative holin-like toxin [Streptococcus suis 89-5259]MCK4024661.1 putative holin-like toxin [Streptococcus suis]NQF81987.1 putative holin-like toxin [Streptococcus suis]NQH66713.1 putative holin-like toxin [Streptococcus suis]
MEIYFGRWCLCSTELERFAAMSVAEALGLMFQFGTLLIVLLTFIFNNRKK